MTCTVAAFYKFVALPDFESRQPALAETLNAAGVKGTVLLASEGVNGTIAGTEGAIDTALAALRALPGCETLEAKFAEADEMPFLRLKVRLKHEIVSMGVPGTDTRNDYEVAIGTFEGAIDPNTKTFREFPDWFRDFRAKLEAEGRKPKVAMFCTGGIRCEKATSFVKSEGIEDVFHLQGGILKYLETVPESDTKWQGECFVFDERVSVRHDLTPGSYDMCHACKRPLSEADMQHAAYEPGVACPHCITEMSDDQRARFAERQKQIDLARARGQQHMGPEARRSEEA
jgi:UPF0176 protein